MQLRKGTLLLLLHLSVAAAIVDVRKAHQESVATLTHSSASASYIRGSRVRDVVGTQSSEGGESDEDERFKPWHCHFVVFAWLVVACCGFPIQQQLGPELGNCCQFSVVLACIIYAHVSGLWDAWYSGAKLGFTCQLACWLVFFQIAIWICTCACLCCLGGLAGVSAVIIKNKCIKQMHAEYEEKKQQLSGPRRDYFESDLFRQKCDQLFDELDTDGNGSLDMSELQPLIVREFGEMDPLSCHLLRVAFDENGDSKVGKGEFMHMMQYVRMKKFNPGDFTEESAWEVMQLDPKTATHSDVKKAYHKMSLKYHPDKRTDGSKADAAKDMQELNDAKALLDKKFGN